LKCNFDAEKIPILWVLVGREEAWIENNKVKAVTEWKTPTKIKETESFLEFTNFYQQLIKNFNYTARPLNELKKRKSGNGTMNLKTCNKRSSIVGTRRKMETHCIFIKNNATSRVKLWNLQQRTTCNSKSPYKVETIPTGCYKNIWSLDRPWKSQIL